MASDHIRASDRDRDAVVAVLRDAYSEGRLTLEEFQERTTTAYAGTTWGDLRELTTDLPVQPVLGAELPPEVHPDAPAALAPAPGQAGTGARPAPGAQPAVPGQGSFPGPAPYPGAPPYPGPYPFPVSRTSGQPAASQPPSPPQRRGRSFGPVLPVVAMWVLFAMATRSAGGAIAFLIAVALLVALSSIGRRPPRGPSGRN
ncbi:MAG TPA: DUF1707 domain-containing protein [Trebonia sp.]|jgi:hypothetical protein|nr:DUF1707 domain-containing protein [Trebonia sp.]